MKVFIINHDKSPLTIDSTLITVDSTLITVDATAIDDMNYKLKCLTAWETSAFTVTLKNENTNESTVLDFINWYYEGAELVAFFEYDFKEGDSFEITIRDLLTGEVIRRDKAFATEQGDLENYELLPTNDNGKKIWKY